MLKCNKVTARKVCSEQRWMKWWKDQRAQGKYLMYFRYIPSPLYTAGTFSQYEASLNLYYRPTVKCMCAEIYLPTPIWNKKKRAICCRGQLNNDSYWRSMDDGRPWTIHRKGSEISWGFVYRFGSHKHKRGSLNLTDQTDQAENRAGPVNSEDYGNGCLASNHFARQKTQEGSSLIQFHSYCQVSLALTGPGVSRQPDRALAIDLLNCNESDCFFFLFYVNIWISSSIQWSTELLILKHIC